MFSSVVRNRFQPARVATSSIASSTIRSLASVAAPADKQKLIVFDTTLRDGEQSPGVTLTTEEKIEIAKQLSRLGVDVCEAGFPIASPGDFEAVQRIAKEVGPIIGNRKSGKPMRIAGLARATQTDIARCFDAVKHAPLHRIHTFLATSDIHLKYKLKITRAECITRARAAVAFAKSIGCNDIEFSTEDAGRSERAFLCEVLAEVIAAGATTLNIPDTVGYNVPEEYGAMIKYLIQHTEGAEKAIWSTHCHNDLGLATANSLSGIMNGARQVECTINGIGERAGNTSLEEVIMTLHTHPKYYPVYHDLDTTQIYMSSQLVTKKSGMVIQPNKAIVGANAFAHESGIHQDGVLKHKETYEIIQPQTIGLPSNSLVLGKLSGRNAFRQRIEQILGSSSMYAEKLASNPQAFELLFASFKKLADVKKGGLNEQDLYALLDDQFNIQASGKETYRLKSVQVVSGNGVQSMATVSLTDLSRATVHEDGTVEGAVERMDAATGEGAVHSIFRSINRLTGMRNVLASYEVKAVTEGSDSLGRVVVRVHENGGDASDEAAPKYADNLEGSAYQDKEVYQGTGTDADVLIASAKAYINAINRLISTKQARDAAAEQHHGEVVDGVKKEGAAAV
ncbi:2-isopropylmalate synthase [Obelidium mucronatum]|nr:2-isopropylmalate synthase [Obelidium mucronatum]